MERNSLTGRAGAEHEPSGRRPETETMTPTEDTQNPPDVTPSTQDTSALDFDYIETLIHLYYQSKPGLTHEHRGLANLISYFHANTLDEAGILSLRRRLITRLRANKQANQDAQLLGLDTLPPIEQWSLAQTSRQYDRDTFWHFTELIARSRLFSVLPSPSGTIFPYYRKPSQYMAAAMLLAGYNASDVRNAIGRIRQARGEYVSDSPENVWDELANRALS